MFKIPVGLGGFALFLVAARESDRCWMPPSLRRRKKGWIEVAGDDRARKGGDGGESDAGRRVAVDRLPWGQIRVYPVAVRDEANFG